MTMLATKTETRALTLADYEARIHLYKEQIGTGYIGIGRTLLEAKEAKVVPHGQWESWVTETTGLTPRQAQRCMQAATEIKDGTAMARLEMSKALLLLSSGLDAEQQEEIAGKAVEEGATVKDLREQLKQAKLKLVQETGAATEIREALKKSEEEKDTLVQQIRARESAYQVHLDEAREDAYKRGEMAGSADAAAQIRQLRNDLESNRQQRQSLKDQLAGEREATGKKVFGLQNEVNKYKQYAEELRRELEEKKTAVPADFAKDREILLAAAEEAEKRAADAEAELEALKAGKDPNAEPMAHRLSRAVNQFFSECELMPFHIEKMDDTEARWLDGVLDGLIDWCERMQRAIGVATVEAEGAVE